MSSRVSRPRSANCSTSNYSSLTIAQKTKRCFVAASSPATAAPAFKLHVLSNPINQGYGGNQKIGYHFAIRNGFDYVALLHGDGQYAPECLPELVTPLLRDEADAVFGSRMLTPGAALRGGMPLYKFVGNKILTAIQNRLLRSRLSEFHSGYRIYSTNALRSIPFSLNSQGFPFDTEIIIQLMIAGKTIRELAIPTYYGSEISHVNGIPYAWDVVRKTLIARSQELGLFYDRRFDCAPRGEHGTPRDAFPEPGSAAEFALRAIPPGARVLNLGGQVAAAFRTTTGGLAPEKLKRSAISARPWRLRSRADARCRRRVARSGAGVRSAIRSDSLCTRPHDHRERRQRGIFHHPLDAAHGAGQLRQARYS